MTAGTDWSIYYAYTDSQPTSIEVCTALLASVVGTAITTDIGPMEGNPRDFYVRSVRLMCDARDGVQVIVQLHQDMRGVDDPETITRLTNVQFRGPMSATRTAIWEQIRDALVPLGYTNPALTEMEVVLIDMSPKPSRVRRAKVAKPRQPIPGVEPPLPSPSPSNTGSPLDVLLAAVIAHPDDDASRRAYADALLAAGDVHGEFIHVQCDLALGALSRDVAIQRRQRERELLAAHGKAWIGDLFGIVTSYRFRRGFVDEVTVDAAVWSSKRTTMLAAAPVLRAVYLGGLLESTSDARDVADTSSLVIGRLRQALASPNLSVLSGLGLLYIGYGDRESQFDMYDTTSLGDHAMKLLVEAEITHLRALTVDTPTPEGVRILATSPVLASLERLSITGTGTGTATGDLGEVFTALDPARVRSLELDDWHPAIGRFTRVVELSLVETSQPVPVALPSVSRLTYRRRADLPLTAEDIAAIASWRGVVELELHARHLPGWTALEHARFDDLRILRVVSPEVTYEQARQLRSWPIAARLEVLQIAGVSEDECAELSAHHGFLVELARFEAPSVLGNTSR